MHLSAGLAFGLMDVPLRWALTAAVAYELVEHVEERRQRGQRLFVSSGPDVALSSVLDAVALAVGHGHRWNETRLPRRCRRLGLARRDAPRSRGRERPTAEGRESGQEPRRGRPTL